LTRLDGNKADGLFQQPKAKYKLSAAFTSAANTTKQVLSAKQTENYKYNYNPFYPIIAETSVTAIEICSSYFI